MAVGAVIVGREEISFLGGADNVQSVCGVEIYRYRIGAWSFED